MTILHCQVEVAAAGWRPHLLAAAEFWLFRSTSRLGALTLKPRRNGVFETVSRALRFALLVEVRRLDAYEHT